LSPALIAELADAYGDLERAGCRSIVLSTPSWEVSVVGGTGPAFTNDFGGLGTSVVGGTPDLTRTWLGGLSTMTLAPIDIESFAFLRNPSNQADAAALLKLTELPGDLNRTTLAPNGTIYAGNGQYEGSDGSRGSYSHIWERPDRPGEYEVRP